MRRAPRSWGLAALVAMGVLSSHAVAQEPTGAGVQQPTEEAPAERPAPAASAAATAAPAAKPKLGDVSTAGYLRAGFGASSQKGRMVCFALANPQGLISKYRLGNECEVWGEFRLNAVVYAGDDGSVATLHFMPTVYIPTSYIGYSPNGAVSAPDQLLTSTGAVLYFPDLYADIKGIPWLFGGTAWAGTRYYKRESIYISDFFYWNPSGVGAGIEDVALGRIWRSAPAVLSDVRISYAAFAVDGEPVSSGPGSPSLPARIDFGVRNDLQVRGIRPFEGAELQIGGQFIADWSNDLDANGNPVTHNGWGVTGRYVQKLLGGDNKLAVQYGKGGGTGFGTLARFYYPDFSLRRDLSQARFRIVEDFTIQPTGWLGTQVALVYQNDQNYLGSPGLTTKWYSAGTRVGVAFTEHAKVLGEVGYDRVEKSNGAAPQWLAKFTGAVAITAGRGFMTRPELRLFYTWAMWDVAARTATIDSAMLYTTSDFLSGATFGLQGETRW
jgi:maltoporin